MSNQPAWLRLVPRPLVLAPQVDIDERQQRAGRIRNYDFCRVGPGLDRPTCLAGLSSR